jgi:phage portal protein BeeE
MTRILTPDDYRRASGYRRSSAAPAAGGPRAYGPSQWETFDSLSDPRLVDFFANGRQTASGAIVNERMALRNTALFRGVSLIASAMGMLPLQLMERKADGSTEKARAHPLFNLLHRKPNSYQTASEFKSFMQSTALFDGNAYALIVRSRGRSAS